MCLVVSAGLVTATATADKPAAASRTEGAAEAHLVACVEAHNLLPAAHSNFLVLGLALIHVAAGGDQLVTLHTGVQWSSAQLLLWILCKLGRMALL